MNLWTTQFTPITREYEECSKIDGETRARNALESHQESSDMTSIRGTHLVFVLWSVLAMISMPYVGVIEAPHDATLEDPKSPFEIIQASTGFNASDGFTPGNITVQSGDGSPLLDRPDISPQTVPPPAMMFRRSGACLEHNSQTNEAMLIGGRYDPNPSQNGDEDLTNFIEILDVANETWSPSTQTIPQTQAYHECVSVQGKIYSIGDHHPFTSPGVRADGVVHIYDPATGNWSSGTEMPATLGVGLAGMDALDGFIYVAGGVGRWDRSDLSNRTLRYNPATDVWDSMANMSAPRHSFELVAFHGKLYAIGGYVRLFDAALNQTTVAPANHTEIYDPATNTWINGSDLPFKIAAHSAVVHNDEIVLAGGIHNGGKYDEIRGYNPLTDTHQARGVLHTSMYDFDMINIDGTLLYAGGDASTWRFSTWGNAYSDVSALHHNPAQQRGTLLSDLFDVRTGSEGSATPLWLDFTGSAPTDTGLRMQYRTGPTVASLSSGLWRPLGVNQSSEYLELGNHTFTDVAPGDSFIQYQIEFTTQELDEWVTPTLDSIVVGSEEARFVSTPPSSMNPNAALSTIQTFHSAYGPTASYTLQIQPSTYDGFPIIGLDPAVLTYSPATSAVAIVDPDQVLRAVDLAVTHSTGIEGDTVDWMFAITDGIATPYLELSVATNSTVLTSYTAPTLTTIDNELSVEVLSLTSSFSSVGGASVEAMETFPGETPMTAVVDHAFSNSDARLLNGLIEARINVEVVATPGLGGGVYSNPGVWTTLTTGSTTTIEFTLPNGTSGDARVWLEARTTDDFELEVFAFNRSIVLNNEGPVLTSTSPAYAAYSNKNEERIVSFTFNDVGGFSNDTVQGYLWIEALHDASQDGVADLNEYQPTPIEFSNSGNEWTITTLVNDSMNADHETVRVWLQGTDYAGYAIEDSNAENGTLWWESRTPENGQLIDFDGVESSGEVTRLEPTKSFAWAVEVADSNRLTDITRVSLMLGNDPTLGLRYNTNLGTCEALDARIQVSPQCMATTGETLAIQFAGTVDWTFVTPSTNDGRIEIIIEDYDGTASILYENEWTYEPEMNVTFQSLLDTEGAVQGEIVEGWSIASGETIQLNASVYHLLSDTGYSGPVSIYYNGKLQNDRWSGGTSGIVTDGHLSVEFQAPLGAGLLFEMELTVWDPYATQELLKLELPTLRVDGAAPYLLDSTLGEGTSRFHLSEVEIGANIEEANLWSSNLSVTCQVRSLENEWPALTLNRASSTVYDGKTMFSFVFDFSALGDPSELSTQANIACWAEGQDDAGFMLQASTGNSELDPWLILPLNSIGPDVAITEVDITGSTEAGGTMRIGVKLVSLGEAIDEQFNVSIYAESNGERTLVGREVVASIGMNTATTLRSTITVPSGSWTLHVEADAEQTMWEVDETNNAWNRSFGPQTDGMSTSVVLLGGGLGVALLAGAVVLLRRKQSDEPSFEEAPDEAGTTSAVKPTPAGLTGPPPRTSEPKPKPAGLKGPPPRSKPASEAAPAIDGAAALDALLPASTEEPQDHSVGSVVNEWSQLPPGGDYDYALDQTVYKGEECGTWRMNEDKTFTRIE
jgi:hypothetical protein